MQVPMDNPGNIAAAVNSGAFGPPDPRSPMDHVKVLPKQPPGLLDGVPFPSQEQMRALDEDLATEGYRAPKAALRALAELDVPYVRLQDAIGKAARSQNAAWRAHVESIAARVAAGDESVDLEDAYTRDEFASDARERLSAYKAELNKIAARAWAVAEPVLVAKAEFARARAGELEETAKLPFARFHAPYTPPSYVLLLLKYATTLSDGSRRNAGLPSSIIETL
jgi:hypothetical protein